MSNILGKPFEDWVTGQINARQDILGIDSNIGTTNLQYYLTKTPFLRLASSVNLTNNGPDNTTLTNSVLNKLKKNFPSVSLENDNLAKNFILNGGAVSENGQLKSGLTRSNILEGSYGWGGISERGYVPLPGITDANVTYYNNGALSKAVINIRCFSREQFQLIDVLYMRPGYTLLLEFGWSVYIDNNKNLKIFDTFKSEPLSALLDPGDKNQYDIYRLIRKEREKHYGNYDAVYGKISKFGWNFNTDGSYNCRVEITGMGDVIESLKINWGFIDKKLDNTLSNNPVTSVANAAVNAARERSNT
jgi:hypothetical protein